jgi:hypothetical protein
LYLIWAEWDAWRKNHDAKNYSGSGAVKGRGRGQNRGRDDSSLGRSSNKPTGNEYWCCATMGHWAHECHLKPKKEQAHVPQDEEDGSLLLMTATLTRPKASSTSISVVEASSSGVKIKLNEEKVYAHLDEEECDVGTRVLDTGATNHMLGCQEAFMKLDTTVLSSVHFDDVVFNEQAQWDWGTGGNNGELGGGDDVFTVKYTTISQATLEIEGADEEPVE